VCNFAVEAQVTKHKATQKGVILCICAQFLSSGNKHVTN